MLLATHQGQHVFTPGFKLCARYVKLCANFVQFSANSVQSSASSPVQVCHRPISWREMLLAILVSPSPYYDNSDSQRLRFVILEDIIGHTLASWEPKSQWAKNGETWVELVNIGFCVQNVYSYVQLCARCLQLCASWCRSTLAPVEQISLCPQAICLPAIFSHQGANQITPSQINNSAWHLIN